MLDETSGTSEEIKECFIKAFIDLYPENGMKGLSVAALATHAGYSRATFYRYFNSLYDVLEIVEKMATPYREMRTLFGNSKSVNMEEVTRLFLDGLYERKKLIRMLFAHDDSGRYMQRLHAAMKPVFRALAERVYDFSDFELECFSEYLSSAKLSLLKMWALGPDGLSLGYMTKVTDATLEGGFWDRVDESASLSEKGLPYERAKLRDFEENHSWIKIRRGC